MVELTPVNTDVAIAELRDLLAKLVPILDDPDLTIRDRFAMAALPAVIRNWPLSEVNTVTPLRAEIVAQRCYLYAEAMMHEREASELQPRTTRSGI